MLSVTGLNHFYYVRDFSDMRCKHSRVLSIIREQLHREPNDGDVFIVMSKDRRIDRRNRYNRRIFYQLLWRELMGECKVWCLFIASLISHTCPLIVLACTLLFCMI